MFKFCSEKVSDSLSIKSGDSTAGVNGTNLSIIAHKIELLKEGVIHFFF